MRLPQPMLAQPGRIDHLPAHRYGYEVKWDGFRAIVSVNGGLSVRSRRGWDMTNLLPELRDLPVNGVLDGELVAFNEQGLPHFPLVCRRLLHGDRMVPLVFVGFDVLQLDGGDTMDLAYHERRALLDSLELEWVCWRTGPVFEDGPALFNAVCCRGLEGVVAKPLDEPYRPGEGQWVKQKNPRYWRLEQERVRFS